MAVPAVARVTVISSSAAGDVVTVRVIVVPEFSANEVVEVLKVIDGADSFSVIVIV